MKEKLTDPIRIMPEELGPLPSGVDPFERCNLWLLYTTLAWGLEKRGSSACGTAAAATAPAEPSTCTTK